MRPSKKKKKGKQRNPPPRYRKRHKTGAAHTPAVTGSAATGAPLPALALPVPGGTDGRQPSTVVSLHPLAPIIVRSGRPMNAHTDADPAQFPPPSTVAGCLRTAWARATDRPFGSELAQLVVAGPLLVSDDGKLLAPKPADALYFGHGESARCLRAEPRPFRDGCGTDLPTGLLPVQLTEQVEGKPGTGPAWWSWDDLRTFRNGAHRSIDELRRNGWSPPKGDRRTHVSIDPSTGAAGRRGIVRDRGTGSRRSPGRVPNQRRRANGGSFSGRSERR